MENSYNPNRVLENALKGQKICADCPAYHDTEYSDRERRSHEVHPGYLNPDADVVVVLQDPSHPIQWDKYDSWEEYNAESGKSWKEARGHHVSSLLPGGLGLRNLWVTDAVKCPAPYTIEEKQDGTFKRDYDTLLENDEECAEAREREKKVCQTYLKEELRIIDPDVVIGMGNPAGDALMSVLEPNFPTFEIKTSRDGGRVLPTDPLFVISPHWSFGWLKRNPHNEDRWGEGWLHNRPDLQDESQDSYAKVVRHSLELVLDGKLP